MEISRIHILDQKLTVRLFYFIHILQGHSLALWQSYDCHSASEVTLKDMDKKSHINPIKTGYNHHKIKVNQTVRLLMGFTVSTWLSSKEFPEGFPNCENSSTSHNNSSEVTLETNLTVQSVRALFNDMTMKCHVKSLRITGPLCRKNYHCPIAI